jgi:hypothetical protein
MEENYSYINSLIIGSITGQNSESEERILNDWIGDDESRRRLVERFRNPGFGEDWGLPKELNKEKSWGLIQEKLAATPGMPPLPDLKHKEWIGYQTQRKPAIIRYLQANKRAVIAIAVAILACCPLVYLLLNGGLFRRLTIQAADQIASVYINEREIPLRAHITQTVFETNSIRALQEDRKLSLRRINADQHPPPLNDNAVFRVGSQPGQEFDLFMPDSSAVHMDAASQVKFTSDYGTEFRKIRLEKGAAYFVVSSATASTKNPPFVVQVHNTTFTAKGTSFNIQAYSIDSTIRATLVTGHLLVKREQDSIVDLAPGETYVLNQDGSHSIERVPDTSYAVPWRSGQFSFHQQPLAHILEEVGRHYSVSIKWLSPPSDETLDYTNPMSVSLDQILEHLKNSATINKIDYKIDQNTVLVWRSSDTTTIKPAVRE